jgi:hypothetical protein
MIPNMNNEVELLAEFIIEEMNQISIPNPGYEWEFGFIMEPLVMDKRIELLQLLCGFDEEEAKRACENMMNENNNIIRLQFMRVANVPVVHVSYLCVDGLPFGIDYGVSDAVWDRCYRLWDELQHAPEDQGPR